jgi:hypothetical protein
MKRYFSLLTIFLLAIFFVGAGMLNNIIPVFTKPADRGYNGMQGFVDDYIGYVSYVKEGIDGHFTFRIRSLPPPQTGNTSQLIPVYVGKIGGLLGWNAPLTYHIFRAIFGIGLFLIMQIFFEFILGNRRMAILASIFAALSGSVGWYMYSAGAFTYHTFATFGFTDNIALRFASRLHYMVGAIIFIVLSIMYLNGKKLKLGGICVVFILALILSTQHPSFAVLLGAISAVMVLRKLILLRSLKVLFLPYTAGGLGLVAGLLASYISTQHYPYTMLLSFESYVINEHLGWPTISGDLISFGPMLWVGLPGLIWAVYKNRGKRETDIYMLTWLILQLMFFFYLYKFFRSERVRYIQSLYFIPMAYGSVVLLRDMAAKIGRWLIIGGSILVIGSVTSTFIYGFWQSMYYHTDYKYYSLFVFPTRGMIAAYLWLNDHTPRESMVIAGYEAANNILVYSHNYVVGNKQGWPEPYGTQMEKARDAFYLGAWDENTAFKYLKDNQVKYVYKGYQEADGFIGKYKFLKPVFTNNDATIFEVMDYVKSF